jgi:hypothetical protein
MDTTSGRHQINIGHLVMGVAFLGIVGVWGLVQTDTVTGDDIRWLMPIPWVVAGAIGLVASAVTSSRRYAVTQTGWVGTQPEEAAEAEEAAEEEAHAGLPAEADQDTSPQAGLPKYPETNQTPEEQS